MLTELISDKEQTILLHMGSDDGIKVWLNGKVAYKNNTSRYCKANDDKTEIALKAGKNRLLVKITQSAGEWAGIIRISAPDGTFPNGVTVSVSEL
jgi:hypothetical protein